MSKVSKLLQQTFIELYETHKWTAKEIADQFNVKERIIIAIVKKRKPTGLYLCCGKELKQTLGHRQKEFCSPSCYRKWRREHALNSSAQHICQFCGKKFTDPYHLDTKYCSKECRNNAYRKK